MKKGAERRENDVETKTIETRGDEWEILKGRKDCANLLGYPRHAEQSILGVYTGTA